MGLIDFKDVHRFAKGSFGKVFKGVRKGQTYALKQLNVRKMSRREIQEALNEVRLLASVVHRNVLRFCEVFLEGKHLYIVTEFCEGGDVMSYVTRRRGKVKERELWSIFIQTCQGVKALHEKNILHRDLKPQNILLTLTGRVKIADFGCSKVMKANLLALTQCGTPYYMSPELWRNEPYGKASDIWSLGCILYHIASNRPPFDGYSMKDLSNRILHARCPRLKKGRFSVDINLLIRNMLEKLPSHRPSASGIISSEAVQSRLWMLREEDREKESDSKFKVLETIKIPENLAKINSQLPKSKYTVALVSPASICKTRDRDQDMNEIKATEDRIRQELPIYCKQRPTQDRQGPNRERFRYHRNYDQIYHRIHQKKHHKAVEMPNLHQRANRNRQNVT